jgi:hypothetical protein
MKRLIFIEILIVSILSFFNLASFATGGHWSTAARLYNDAAYIVLSTISHNFDLGLPYRDYWELRPPGYLLLIDLWVNIFGFKIYAFKLFEIFFRFGVGLTIYLIARKIFPGFRSFLVATLANIVFFSPAFGTLMYAEPCGLFFSLLGLLVLFYVNSIGWKYFLATFFFVISGQIKDSFNGSVLALIPFLVLFLISRKYKDFFKALIFSFSGAFFAIVPLVIYLVKLNVLNSYFEVLNYKAGYYQLFFWQNFDGFIIGFARAFWLSGKVLTIFNPILVTLITISVLLAVLIIKRGLIVNLLSLKTGNTFIKIPSFKLLLKKEHLYILSIIFFSIGSYVGFYMNNGFTPHYLVIILVSFYFLWSIVIYFFSEIIGFLFKYLPKTLIFSLLLIIFLFPPKWILIQYLHSMQTPTDSIKSAYKNLSSPDADIYDFEKEIISKTSKDDCILSVYGWKSSEAYLYSQRRPCSRFVVANMVYLDWQKEEYRASLIKNPPQVIVDSGAEDISIPDFEKNVLNLTKILKECYILEITSNEYGRYSAKLYFPKYPREKLKSCFQNNIL